MTNAVEVAYEAIQDHVGQVARTHVGRITARDFQRAAAATDDLNPVYFDQGAAREAGHAGVVAPPGYLTSVLEWGWGPPEQDLRPDGVVPATLANAPVEGLRLMGAGQELTFHADVVDGMELVMDAQVHDVVMKAGDSGPFLILRISRTYTDAEGACVLTCLESFIGR